MMHGQAPLRIVHCVRSPIGGIFRHIVDLATAQTRMGHEVGVICDASTGGAFEEAIIDDVAPKLAFGVHRIGMRRHLSMSDLRATVDMLRMIKALSPDVVHGHGAKGGAFARSIGSMIGLGGRRPLRVYCPHGGSLHYDPRTRDGAIYFRLERFLERFTDGFVFVSDYEENTYRAKVGMPTRPVRRVYNGLRPTEFEPIEPNAAMADLMFAGMMRDLKGPQVLIDALCVLADRYNLRPTVRFVGAGDDRASYENRIATLGLQDRVTFVDPLPTREALAQGRVLIVPSLAESMPYIVLEAAAARIPMIATHVGGIPEIFGNHSSRLIAAGDPVELASAIAHTLAHMDKARADAMVLGREIAGRFSLDRMADEIVEFYEDMIERKKPNHQKRSAAGTIKRIRVGQSR
jgi:glycosyltransferase involved in cell wall biosynthesis